MESGCSNVTLEQSEKEWIVKSAIGDCDTISRLLLTDRQLVNYKDFISGYTGTCRLFGSNWRFFMKINNPNKLFIVTNKHLSILQFTFIEILFCS